MKKFIFKLFLFVVITAIVDCSVSLFGDYLQTHAKGGLAKRTNDLVVKDFHDILVMGSSRAHHHYDTPFLSDTLGLDVYNAGYDGNGIVLACGLLEMVLERYKPRMIIYDVEPAFDIYFFQQDHNNTRYLSYLKPYYGDKKIGRIINDISREEWYKVHSGILRYNSNLVTLALDNLKVRNPDQRGGYAPIKGRYTGAKIVRDNIHEVDSIKLSYCQKLITLTKANDIPLVMIASPKYSNETSADLKPVIDICNKNNIPFLDYYGNHLFMEEKAMFKEPMHLNAEGARFFSKLILEDIKKYVK